MHRYGAYGFAAAGLHGGGRRADHGHGAGVVMGVPVAQACDIVPLSVTTAANDPSDDK
jgi:hypothetical protein